MDNGQQIPPESPDLPSTPASTSGLVLPESASVSVNQPTNVQPVLPQNSVPSSSSTPQLLTPDAPQFKTLVWEVKILHTIRWIVTAGLTIEGFKGLYDSLYFIFVEFKNFEAALIMHQLTEDQVNVLVAKTAILLFSTALSLFFALQLALFHHNRIMKWLKILSGIIVFVVSALTMMYANQIPADALLNQLPIFRLPGL